MRSYLRQASIINNWHNVWTLLGNSQKITTGAMRELNCVDNAFRTNNICDLNA